MKIPRQGDYYATIDFEDSEELFHGRIANLRDVVGSCGRSVDELRREFATSLEVYMEICNEKGIDPAKPYSGTFNIRVRPELHRALALAAACDELSLNRWIARALEREAEKARAD